MIIKALTYCVFLLTYALSAQTADPFTGRWENEDRTMIMEIYMKDDAYFGCLVETTDPKLIQHIGRLLVIQMKRKRDALFGGTFTDLQRNTEYETRIKLKDQNTLSVKVFCGLFRHRHKWRRIAY